MKNFGDRILAERENEALLNPSERLPEGIVGVTVKFLDYSYESATKPHPDPHATGGATEVVRGSSIAVRDERGEVISRQFISARGLLAILHERRTLRAINKSLKRANSYARATGTEAAYDSTYL